MPENSLIKVEGPHLVQPGTQVEHLHQFHQQIKVGPFQVTCCSMNLNKQKNWLWKSLLRDIKWRTIALTIKDFINSGMRPVAMDPDLCTCIEQWEIGHNHLRKCWLHTYGKSIVITECSIYWREIRRESGGMDRENWLEGCPVLIRRDSRYWMPGLMVMLKPQSFSICCQRWERSARSIFTSSRAALPGKEI